jgi:hypothetical protein
MRGETAMLRTKHFHDQDLAAALGVVSDRNGVSVHRDTVSLHRTVHSAPMHRRSVHKTRFGVRATIAATIWIGVIGWTLVELAR